MTSEHLESIHRHLDDHITDIVRDMDDHCGLKSHQQLDDLMDTLKSIRLVHELKLMAK